MKYPLLVSVAYYKKYDSRSNCNRVYTLIIIDGKNRVHVIHCIHIANQYWLSLEILVKGHYCITEQTRSFWSSLFYTCRPSSLLVGCDQNYCLSQGRMCTFLYINDAFKFHFLRFLGFILSKYIHSSVYRFIIQLAYYKTIELHTSGLEIEF